MNNDFDNIGENLESSFLKKAGKKQGFQVPEGYFEDLSSNIQDLVAAQVQRESKKAPLFSMLLKPQLIAAYSVVLLIGLFFVLQPSNSSQEAESESITLSSLLAEGIIDADYYDETTLISAYNDEQNSEELIESKAASIIGEDESLTNDEIVEYLASEDLGELTAYLPEIYNE